MHERDPFHRIYAENRDMQSRIIFHKLRHEILKGKKPSLEQRVLMESCVLLILELKYYQSQYLKTKKRAPKEFFSTLNSLRNTLNQLPRTKPKVKGGESGLDLGSIING
jgi:hypothetical protein